MSSEARTPPVPPAPVPGLPTVQDVIAGAAARHHVPLPVALAFAYCESRFDPNQEGDANWAFKSGGALYRKNVLENPFFNSNPWRGDPSLWRSYGLYQLLAPYHTGATEHPRVLLDPAVNADRGLATIARLLIKHAGDATAARVEYVGCGAHGDKCAPAKVAQVRATFERALARFQGAS